MSHQVNPLAELLQKDRRYRAEAYLFVFEALTYAQKTLGMGTEQPSEPSEFDEEAELEEAGEGDEDTAAHRHLTGQQLCEAIRVYAMEQYGYLAKCVLNSWGVHETGDFGEIVFNLISIGKMRKTKDDRREDFDGVFDFESDLQQNFKITLPK